MTKSTQEIVAEQYNIEHWSDGYFEIGNDGCLQARLNCDAGKAAVTLSELVQSACQQGARLPLLVRFKPILRSRVQLMVNAFSQTIKQENCAADYLPVYPVKVNQQKQVVETLLGLETEKTGENCQKPVGLEVGSKAELILALSMAQEVRKKYDSALTIICNGFKDEQYVRLALLAKKSGLNVYVVIEKYNEMQWLLKLSAELSVEPFLGIRVRLSTIGKGNWQNTGGEKSKFGVTASQLLDLVAQLKKHKKDHCFKLLHFHIGSQISNIGDIQRGIGEAARYYVELVKMGLDIKWFDIGGGLGVDYEGAHSRSLCSMNYSVEEYAHNVVHSLKAVCEQEAIKFPNIITESGRALSAHHAVLVTEVFGVEKIEKQSISSYCGDSIPIRSLFDSHTQVQQCKQYQLMELYHEITAAYAEVQAQFAMGMIALEEKALADKLYANCCVDIINNMDGESRARAEVLKALTEKTADKIFLNFSIFRSLPDVWGVAQIFPVVPLSNLDKELSEHGVLQDITCDSDGRIDQYVKGEDIEAVFSLAAENCRQGSLLGVFLVGAYQEILGDNHNLFGVPDAITVDVDGYGNAYICDMTEGDSVSSVMGEVGYEGGQVRSNLRALVACLPQGERQQLEHILVSGFEAGTYLSAECDT